MKIALITDGIWPVVMGGIQKHSFYLSKYLSREGIYVDIYYTCHDKADECRLINLFNTEEIKFINLIYVDQPERYRFPGHYLLECYQYSKRVTQILRRAHITYDLVYIQGFAGWHFLTSRGDGAGLPAIINFHGLNMFQKVADIRTMIGQIMFRPIVKYLLRRSDYVQSLGGRLTNLLTEIGIKKDRILEVGNGIENSWLVPRFDDKIYGARSFVFVGRFDRIKGILELNEALKQLVGRYEFEFHFVGPFPSNFRLMASNIYYYGPIEEERDIKRILDAADFLVLPSYSEGMPTSVLEAMSRSCAIIGCDVGAMNELVSNDNGILIRPKEVNDLVKAIIQGIEMPYTELNKMKQVSFRIVESFFTWEKIIEHMKIGFNGILSKVENKDD